MALWINTNIVFEREMNLLHVTLERVSDAKKKNYPLLPVAFLVCKGKYNHGS